MKKLCAAALLVVGLVVAGVGVYAFARGVDAKDQVRDQLVARDITTPAEASIPNARVDDARTAESMAEYIDATVGGLTGGRSFNEIGQYVAADGTDTNDPTKAALGADGMPTPNPLRAVAFEASTAQTSLYTSVIAYNIGDVAIGLGIALGVVGLLVAAMGVVLSGLRLPAFAHRAERTAQPRRRPLVATGH